MSKCVHYYGHIAKNEQLSDQWIGYKYAKEDSPSTNHQHWILGKILKFCNPHLCFATNIEAEQNKRKNQEQEQGMGQVNGIETQLKRNDMECGSPSGSTLKTLNLNSCFKNALSTCTITLKIATPKQ